MANFTQSSTRTNLVAHTVTVPNADTYYIQCTMILPSADPSASQGPGGGAGTGVGGGARVPSQIIMTVRQNGSVILTTPAGSQGFSIPNLPCAANDVLTFTPSSSLPQDQQPNAFRMTLVVSQGTL